MRMLQNPGEFSTPSGNWSDDTSRCSSCNSMRYTRAGVCGECIASMPEASAMAALKRGGVAAGEAQRVIDECRARFNRLRRNGLPPGALSGVTDSIKSHARAFPGGYLGYARYAADSVARRVGLRRNPDRFPLQYAPGFAGGTRARYVGRMCRIVGRGADGPIVEFEDGKRFPVSSGALRNLDDAMARVDRSYRGTRDNPSLILVHAGNPPKAPAALEKAWCRFHQKDRFDGSIRSVGAIPGTPQYTFGLGRLVDVDLGRGPQTISPRPWLVCAPDDMSLWIVAEGRMKLGNGVAGSEIKSVTYAPFRESGKDVANYRHAFHKPLPTFSPLGNPNDCRAVVLDGGRYVVTDWIRQ